MKRILIVTLVAFYTLTSASLVRGQSQNLKAPGDAHHAIASLNAQTEKLYRNKDIGGILNQFDQELAFLPEYKPAIFDSKSLASFFDQWFRVCDVKSFSKKIYSLEIIDQHLLELGTFEMLYANSASEDKSYSGNYLVLWKKESQGVYKIVSHAAGSDTQIKLDDVPWANVVVQRNNIPGSHNVDGKVLKMVEDADAKVIRAVKEGDGETRANGYTEDAILMPNFEKMYVGMDMIRPRMLKTYYPGVSYNVHHTFNRIYDLGGYVFLTGHYAGGWGDKNNGGWFEGNMSGLMKKTPDGKLKAHRQLTNRDSELLLFNN